MKRTFLLACTLTLSLLAACGGGSDTVSEAPPAADTTVPASATANAQAYSQYTATVKDDDRAEPLDLDTVQAPASETDEPIDVV